MTTVLHMKQKHDIYPQIHTVQKKHPEFLNNQSRDCHVATLLLIILQGSHEAAPGSCIHGNKPK
jgi:hypothetical protein